MQTSDVFSVPVKPSYLSHVHLPTVSVPTLWYWIFAGAAMPAIPVIAPPRRPFIASICARCSGVMFAIICCSCAIAGAICAAIFSTSAPVSSL